VYAAASEDMDTLTFGAPRLVRKMWASEAAKMPVLEFSLDKVLAGLELSYDQFVDVCILAGCDYADTIRGIAATTAYKQVRAGRARGGVGGGAEARVAAETACDRAHQST
jgi:flap endonuclease-1